MSVLTLFGAVKNLLRFGSKSAHVSNCLLTTSWFFGVLLAICSILTTAKQFFGDPINCSAESTGAWTSGMYNSYCFMVGTSTWKPAGNLSDVNAMTSEELLKAHTGIYVRSHQEEQFSENVHNYYQWIPFILFAEAILFYFPYRVWKGIIGERLDKLLAKVNKDPLNETSIDEQVEGLSNFLVSHPNWFNKFAWKMFIVDLAVLGQAGIQFYLLDRLLDGEYVKLITSFVWRDFQLVVEEMFPLVTSCVARHINTGGGVTTLTGTCVMNINILNQKIFVFTWFLHVFIILLGGLVLLKHILFCVNPVFRFLSLRFTVSGESFDHLRLISSRSSYGQHLLIKLLIRNMDDWHIESLMEQLYNHYRTNKQFSSSPMNQRPMSRLHQNFGGGKHAASKENLLPTIISDSFTETPTIDLRLRAPPVNRVPVLPPKDAGLPVYSTTEKTGGSGDK